jgi:fluoroquinolone transport system permease protein
MYAFFALYPLILGVVAWFLVPYLEDQGSVIAAQITVLVFILMTGFVYGAITGFSLLDDQDDNVIMSLRITPVSVRTYLAIKLFVSYLSAIVATAAVIIVTDFLPDSGAGHLLMIILLSSLQAPFIALMINAFSRNKVEGFVIMKTTGILLLVPIASLFLSDWKELLLSVIPGFWPARLVSIALIPTSDPFLGTAFAYFVSGIVVNTVAIMLLYKLYTRKLSL